MSYLNLFVSLIPMYFISTIWIKEHVFHKCLLYFRLTKRRHDDWLIALGRDPTREHLSTSNMVCSDHFSEEHKVYFSKTSFRLKCNAVPTLRLKRRNILANKEIYCNRYCYLKVYCLPFI